jgi:hypothetical protein
MVDIVTLIIFFLILKRKRQYNLHTPPGAWI